MATGCVITMSTISIVVLFLSAVVIDLDATWYIVYLLLNYGQWSSDVSEISRFTCFTAKRLNIIHKLILPQNLFLLFSCCYCCVPTCLHTHSVCVCMCVCMCIYVCIVSNIRACPWSELSCDINRAFLIELLFSSGELIDL